jgi:tetratricopeptide (TPR) repeat protein
MKEKNYAGAVKSYSEGIKLDPKNPILYSNRAQGYLFLKEYQNTVNDCNMALKFSPSGVNVKALFRRAKAFVELKQLHLAKEDLLNILKTEPKNVEARQTLQHVNGMLNTKTPVKKFPEPVYSPRSPEFKVGSPERVGAGDSEYPKRIMAIQKPPHLQSKRVILPVPVRIKGETNNSKRNSMSFTNSSLTSPITPAVASEESMSIDGSGLVEDIEMLSTVEVPPKPTTVAQFMSAWKQLKDHPGICAQYLNQLQPEDYSIFQDSMDLQVLSEILTILQWEFLPRKWPFTHHLQGLLRVRRLGTLFMLMTEKDRANARNLISRCDSDELRNYYTTNFTL